MNPEKQGNSLVFRPLSRQTICGGNVWGTPLLRSAVMTTRMMKHDTQASFLQSPTIREAVGDKTLLDPSRISASDRRHAAIHEAGHIVVARHLGLMTLQAEIRKIEPLDISEKGVGGIDPI